MKKFNPTSFFSKFPTIDLGYFPQLGTSFEMRDMLLRDTEDYLNLYLDPAVNFAHADEDMPTNLDDATQAIKFWGSLFYNKRAVFWTIADKATQKFIGNIGFVSYNITNRRAEISYDISPSYQRNGIMSAALQAAINIAFNRMNVYRIEGRTVLSNQPSQALLKKNGFKQEAVLRGYRVIHNVPTDITLFSLIKDDHEKLLRDRLLGQPAIDNA